jgi:hypothetical protein
MVQAVEKPLVAGVAVAGYSRSSTPVHQPPGEEEVMGTGFITPSG